jgi:CRISPR-associated protein Csx10
LAAGSVLTVKVSDLDPQKLIDLMAEGIGERRAEGFGRLAFEWPSQAILTEEEIKGEPTASEVSLAGTADAELALHVGERILRRRLAERVTATALKHTVSGDLPHNSQLARLRGLVQEELMKPQPDLIDVMNFIAGLANRKVTKRQFEAAKVGDETLDKWLLEQLSQTDEDSWRNFFYQPGQYPIVQLGDIKVEPTEEMRKEHLLRWLAVFLQRLTKQKGDQ